MQTHEAVCSERYKQIVRELKELKDNSVNKDEFKRIEKSIDRASNMILSLITVLGAAALGVSPIGAWVLSRF